MSELLTIETECHVCAKPVPLPLDGAGFYWTPRGYEETPVYCPACAPRAKAIIVKPQGKKPTITGCNGWESQL